MKHTTAFPGTEVMDSFGKFWIAITQIIIHSHISRKLREVKGFLSYSNVITHVALCSTVHHLAVR